jgi:hypothetical protein
VQATNRGGGGADDSRESNRDDRARKQDREIERYREAATSALEQLEWIVDYLREIGRGRIASAIDRNRKQIMRAIRE